MKEALKLALEALEHINDRFDLESVAQDATIAITALREALAEQPAQPQQEPVAEIVNCGGYAHVDWKAGGKYPVGTKFYTTPPKRPWVGLTDDEMQALWDRYAHMEMMRAIEAKLKEKNT